MNALNILNKNVSRLKLITFLLSVLPALQLFYHYKTDQLGINGLETLLHHTGLSALVLYIITLAITPLRRIFSYTMILACKQYGKRLGDWNWMIKLRRLLGVLCFLYATLHFVIFFYFELDFEFSELYIEVEERPFILAGMVALLLLLPLFLTSTNYSMKRLKRNWRRIHRLMYPIGLIISLHYLWLSKAGVYDAYPYVFIIVLLMLFRVFDHYKIIFTRQDDGMEATRK